MVSTADGPSTANSRGSSFTVPTIPTPLNAEFGGGCLGKCRQRCQAATRYPPLFFLHCSLAFTIMLLFSRRCSCANPNEFWLPKGTEASAWVLTRYRTGLAPYEKEEGLYGWQRDPEPAFTGGENGVRSTLLGERPTPNRRSGNASKKHGSASDAYRRVNTEPRGITKS